MSAHPVEIELVAQAIHDAVFEEQWDHLDPDDISRVVYRNAAKAAIDRLDNLRKYARPPFKSGQSPK